MASVLGKWKLEHSEMFEEYMAAIGVAEDKRADAHKYLSDGSGMTQEFNADGDNWTIMSSTSKGGMEFKFTIGQETNSITLDGRPIKVIFTIDGDSLVEKQKGEGFETTHVRKGSGNQLTMTLTGNGVTCTRTFSKV